MYICFLRCESEFYSPWLPKVPGTQRTLNACLFSEWMKTEKIIRNMQRALSNGEKIPGHIQSEGGDSQGWQILIVEGERGSYVTGCLPALLLQPVQNLRPWPGNTWLATETPKDRSAFVWGYHTESYQLCFLSSGHSWIPPSWFSVIALAPLCAHWTWGCLFY